MVFVVNRLALGQVFSEYLGSPFTHSTECSTLVTVIIIIIIIIIIVVVYHLGLVQ
jgi:heme/copper-type cytochrome/quinol oxidase subunit 2